MIKKNEPKFFALAQIEAAWTQRVSIIQYSISSESFPQCASEIIYALVVALRALQATQALNLGEQPERACSGARVALVGMIILGNEVTEQMSILAAQ